MRRIAAVSFFFALVGGAPVAAQRPTHSPRAARTAPMAQAGPEAMLAGLHLTTGQRQAIRSIRAEFAPKIHGLQQSLQAARKAHTAAKAAHDVAGARRVQQEIRQDAAAYADATRQERKRMIAVLTPAQRQVLEERMRATRGAGRTRGVHPAPYLPSPGGGQ